MNWKEIKKKYTRARKLLDSWKYEGLETDCMSWVDKYGCGEDVFNIRDLYDFFDEQGIYIQISPKCTINNSVLYLPYIWGMYKENSIDFDQHLQEGDNRTKAEKTAFLKAFEILEEKLIKK